MGKLDPDDARPPYQQIADALRTQIGAGEIGPGEQLPAISTLVSEYEVSVGTARSAMNVLRDEGLIVTRHGKGSYVRTRPREGAGVPDADEAIEDLHHKFESLAERVEALERKLSER